MRQSLDRVQDRSAFEEELTDFLSDFIAERELYPSESVLAVNSRSREIRIGVPEDFSRAWELYNLAQLFRDEEAIGIVPDCDAVSEIAASFFFIR